MIVVSSPTKCRVYDQNPLCFHQTLNPKTRSASRAMEKGRVRGVSGMMGKHRQCVKPSFAMKSMEVEPVR